jgi:hypothetical protein
MSPPTSGAPVGTDRFLGLRRDLGYDPDRVLSIRVNRCEIVVTHIDDSGTLASARHVPHGARDAGGDG